MRWREYHLVTELNRELKFTGDKNLLVMCSVVLKYEKWCGLKTKTVIKTVTNDMLRGEQLCLVKVNTSTRDSYTDCLKFEQDGQ